MSNHTDNDIITDLTLTWVFSPTVIAWLAQAERDCPAKITDVVAVVGIELCDVVAAAWLGRIEANLEIQRSPRTSEKR